MLQDREGFYWIATQNGLNRFDGSGFKIFRHNEDDTTSLANNHCTAIIEDHVGDIWVATYKGVCRYKKSTGRFQRIILTHPSKNTEIANRIYNIAIDKEGNIWMCGNGVWRFHVKDNKIDLFRHDPNDSTSLSRNILITRILYDSTQNGLWVSTGTEINFYSIDKKQFYHLNNNPLQWKIFNVADGAEIAFDNGHRLWFRDRATQALHKYDVNKNQIITTNKIVETGIKQIANDPMDRLWIFYWLKGAEIFDPANGISNSSFFSVTHERSVLTEKGNFLYIDRYDNYWIGSEKGINIYNASNQFYKFHKVSFEKSKEDEIAYINAIAQNDSSHLWIGTNIGLFHYDLITGDKKKIRLPFEKTINSLTVVDKILWVSTNQKLTGIDVNTFAVKKIIAVPTGYFFLRRGKNNDLWLGAWTDGLFRLNLGNYELQKFTANKDDPNTPKSKYLITGFPEKDGIWIGYNGGAGLSKYSIQDNRWRHYHPNGNNLANENFGTISVITKVVENQYWLGTHGGGIFYFNPENSDFQNYQQEDGLNSNYINSIIPDLSGNLWISTADGIGFFNNETKKLRALNIGLVFPNNDFKDNGIPGVNGKLYFFGVRDLIEIDPTAFMPVQSSSPLVITSFKIFDREIPYNAQQKTIELSHRENFFTFNYSTIRTQPQKEVQYAYILQGFDKAWHHAGTQQQASYTNVPGGNYVFQVKATNEDGIWSDPLLTIPVHIKPPYWATWWFIGLCIITGAAIAYAFHLYRISQVKKIYSVRTQISRDLHDDIGASLSSINIYSSVAESEVKDNPDKAKEIIQQINVNSRQVMENISDIVWANRINRTEDDTLASRIRNYGYDLLAHKNIDGTYSIDPNIEKRLSSPEARKSILLIIKEAINNIAKYSNATSAEVKVEMNGTDLNVRIEDNGRGLDANNLRKGNGLIHMQQRAEALGGTISFSSAPGGGTQVHAKIPLANISDR